MKSTILAFLVTAITSQANAFILEASGTGTTPDGEECSLDLKVDLTETGGYALMYGVDYATYSSPNIYENFVHADRENQVMQMETNADSKFIAITSKEEGIFSGGGIIPIPQVVLINNQIEVTVTDFVIGVTVRVSDGIIESLNPKTETCTIDR